MRRGVKSPTVDILQLNFKNEAYSHWVLPFSLKFNSNFLGIFSYNPGFPNGSPNTEDSGGSFLIG
jgi:hypothetical protein